MKREDLTGKKFGKWTVLEYDTNYKWICKCDCGKIKSVSSSNLKNGNSTSCGCNVSKDLSNKKFGRLTTIEPTKERYYGYIVWKCKCDCGNEFLAPMHNILNGNIKSCGCLVQENRDNWGTTVAKLRKEKYWDSHKNIKKKHKYKRVEGIDI